MISAFIKEQKRYSKENLMDIFKTDEKNIVHIINRLKVRGVLKTVKKNDKQLKSTILLDEDIEEIEDEEDTSNRYLYVFTFVGIIIVEGCVLKCYPKYINSVDNPLIELQQVMKVLERYKSKEQVTHIFNSEGKTTAYNLLSTMMYLLKDYYENGSYINDKLIVEVNGTGEVLWDRNINYSYPIIQDDCPYYVDLQTRKRVVDDYDFFKRLHEAILKKCSQEISNAGLMEILDLTEVNLTDEELEDFGDIEYLLYRIQSEKIIQFNTTKQKLLDLMEAFLSNKRTLDDTESFYLLGTTSFNLVWEKVCATILDNKLQVPLKDLQMIDSDKYNKDDTLLSIIEKPLWTIDGNNIEASQTLKPDIVTLVEEDSKVSLYIFDAKYYVMTTTQNLISEQPGIEQITNQYSISGQPGIESITKQFLYQLAYKQFTEDHQIENIKNCFLFPVEGGEIIKKGHATLKMLEFLFGEEKNSEQKKLERIQIILLPATEVYSDYLNSFKMDISKLEL